MGTEAVFADAASTYLIVAKIEVGDTPPQKLPAKLKSYVTVMEDEGYICSSLASYVRGTSSAHDYLYFAGWTAVTELPLSVGGLLGRRA